jgi:glyoxylate/hydroxypyruvate reductase A
VALMFFSSGAAGGDTETWIAELGRRLPDDEVRVWPEVGAVEDIEFALVWKHRPGELKRYPNLKGILSLGAGVEHVLEDPGLPAGVPVVRLVDRLLTSQMTEYVTLAVLHHHRRMPAYAAQQAARQWRSLPPADTEATTVGLLGLGVLGQAAAHALGGFGFRLAGWSRTRKALDGIDCFAGGDGLEELLRRANILVCLLPATAATEGLLDARAFGLLPEGAALVSAGRGAQVVEADLLAALEMGHLAGATLDVFAEEPLPADHALWRQPGVVITPHSAADSIPRTAAPVIADNIRRLRAGQPPIGLVDRKQGY